MLLVTLMLADNVGDANVVPVDASTAGFSDAANDVLQVTLLVKMFPLRLLVMCQKRPIMLPLCLLQMMLLMLTSLPMTLSLPIPLSVAAADDEVANAAEGFAVVAYNAFFAGHAAADDYESMVAETVADKSVPADEGTGAATNVAANPAEASADDHAANAATAADADYGLAAGYAVADYKDNGVA